MKSDTRNSTSDARAAGQEIRQELIESRAVDTKRLTECELDFHSAARFDILA